MHFDPKPGTSKPSTFSASAREGWWASEREFPFSPKGITRTAEKQIRSTRLPLAAADCGGPACTLCIFGAGDHGYRPKLNTDGKKRSHLAYEVFKEHGRQELSILWLLYYRLVQLHGVHCHTVKILRLSEDLPMIVEIADSLKNIERFLPTLDEMIKDGLVTLERVRVIQYKA